MKKLLFYTYWKFDDADTNGITKKILSQKEAFERHGYRVDLAYLLNGNYYIEKNGKRILIQKKPPFWTKLQAENKLKKIAKQEKYDYAYFRYNCCDICFISLLKCLKENGAKSIIEIPTVEYEKELINSFLGKVLVFVDKIHRKSIKKYVSRIVVFQNYKHVFGIKTIKIPNGIDVQTLPPKKIIKKSDEINILSLALYQPWHGLERILYGLADYYKNEVSPKIILHIVGDGVALPEYIRIIKNNKLEKYVKVYGLKRGEELSQLFDKCDLAVEVLGGHKKGLTTSSSIKSREYISRGIPFISEVKVDIIPDNWEYLIKVPYDDSPINMNMIVDYYKDYLSTYEKRKKAVQEMRDFAIANIDMNSTMKPVMLEFDT